MTVQELFEKVAAVEAADAYFLLHTIFFPYERRALQDKIDTMEKLKQMIEDHIQRFVSCKAVFEKRRKTIFVLEEKGDEYPPRGDVVYSLFAVYDDEALKKLQIL